MLSFQRDRAATVGSTSKEKTGTPPDEQTQNVFVPALTNEQAPKLTRFQTVRVYGRVAVKRARWKRLVYGIVGILLVTIWCGVCVNFAQTEVKNQAKNAIGANHFIGDSANDTNRDQGFFLLQGNLVDFQTEARVLTVSWSAFYLLNGQIEPFGSSSNSDYELGVFRDEEVILTENQTFIDRGFQLRLSNTSAVPIAVIANPWSNFDTDIEMQQLSPKNAWRQPEYGFPFDKWTGSMTLGANYYYWAKIYGNMSSCATYWDYAYLSGSIINWKFRLAFENTCLDPNVDSCNMIMTINASRSGLVVFACVVAVIVNWLSTIFIFVMTMEGVVMRRFEVIEGPQLLAVCFTALFALPSVRSILPGAPEFGALIDLVGIVPNVILISLCTTMVAVATLRKFIHRNNEKSDQQAATEEATAIATYAARNKP